MTATLRASAIKVGYLKSMLHMRHYIDKGQDDTPAMRWGRLVHMAVLEPLKRPSVWDVARRGKAYQEWIDNQPYGVETCTAKEWEEAQICAASVRGNRRVAELLSGTRSELLLAVDDPELGKCTASLDAHKPGVIIDVKTTGQISARAIERQCAAMAYHLQFGWYADMAIAAGLENKLPACYIVAIESKPPYDSAVYQLRAFDVSAGLTLARQTARRYRDCEAAGVFPGCQDGEPVEIALPEWAYGDGVGLEDGNMEDL